MTKYLYAGAPADYPTLGFSADVNGAILDGAASSPAITTPPDARWSVYGGGSAESGITRYASPSGPTSPTEPSDGYVLRYSDTDNSYVPTSPTDFVDLPAVSDALATSFARQWKTGQTYDDNSVLVGDDGRLVLAAYGGDPSGDYLEDVDNGVLIPTTLVGADLAAYTPTTSARTVSASLVGASIDRTGTTDSTTAIQAALNALPTNGTLFVPLGTYKISDTLTIPVSCSIIGGGVSENYVAGASIDHPTGSPAIKGTVFVQTAASKDAFKVGAAALSINVSGLGVRFTQSATGHGFNFTAPTSTDVGLVSGIHEDIIVADHDGDHYGFVYTNTLLGSTRRLRAYGGGNIQNVCTSLALNTGNMVHDHQYNFINKSGTAAGYSNVSRTSSGGAGTLNLMTFIRPQCNMGSGNTAQRMWDDKSGAGVPNYVTVVSPDFESPASDVRFGSGTQILGSVLISGTTYPSDSSSIGLGKGALPNPTGGALTALGFEAMAALGDGSRSSSLTNSTALGYRALKAATVGRNTAVGASAGTALTTGSDNTLVGVGALAAATTAGGNVAVGLDAMSTASAGNSVAIGYQALTSATTVGTSGRNVAIGFQAGVTGTPANATINGGDQTVVGYQAGQSNNGNGYRITALGYQATAGTNYATALGALTVANANGAVAIGIDSAGTAASTTTQNAFALGTALHLVQVKNNTTGSGSASLGANCPATTPTAPYTWFKMLSNDGSTVYVPAWK